MQSKQQLARELRDMGCTLAFNTLRKYDLGRLMALHGEVTANFTMAYNAQEAELQGALDEPQEPEPLPGSEIEASELVPVTTQADEPTEIGYNTPQSFQDAPYSVPALTDREIVRNALESAKLDVIEPLHEAGVPMFAATLAACFVLSVFVAGLFLVRMM